MDPDGTDPVQLTSNSVYDAQPAYSPDGTRIAFQSSADGDQEIYTMDPSPLAPATNITNTTSGITDELPDWGDTPPPPPPPAAAASTSSTPA